MKDGIENYIDGEMITKEFKENYENIINPNKEYIIFQKDAYDEIEKCNKDLNNNSFMMGLGIGILIMSIIFTVF